MVMGQTTTVIVQTRRISKAFAVYYILKCSLCMECRRSKKGRRQRTANEHGGHENVDEEVSSDRVVRGRTRRGRPRSRGK